MNELTFKKLDLHDLPRLNHFLKQHKESSANKGDCNFWLTYDNQIIACARLQATKTQHCFWLRGVFVDDNYRKQGLGSEFINRLHQSLEKKTLIIAFPYEHLHHFYSQLGYQDIEPEQLPKELFERFSKAQKQNKKWLCMSYKTNI